MRPFLVGATVFVAVVFQHFELGRVGGYPITVTLIVGIVALPFVFPKPRWLPVLTAEAVFLTLAALAALSNIEVLSTEFFGTLALFAFSVAVLTQSAFGARPGLVRSRAFQNGLFAALATVVTLSVAQTATGTAKIDVLFNPFRHFQYFYEYNPRLDINPVPRAQGFFLEPSYDAFVIGTLTIALLCVGTRTAFTAVLGTVGMLACQSASGLGILLVIALILALTSQWRIALPAAGALVLVLGLLGPYLWGRVYSITNSETSAYYRIVAPVRIVRDVLERHPFGYPMGSVFDVLSSYQLTQAGVPQNSLDNGSYVLIFYFGWVGVLFLMAAVTVTVRVFLTRRSRGGLGWIAPLWLIGSLFFSGAIMAPEFTLMTGIVVVCFTEWRRSGRGTPGRALPQRHHRDVSGSERPAEDAALAR